MSRRKLILSGTQDVPALLDESTAMADSETAHITVTALWPEMARVSPNRSATTIWIFRSFSFFCCHDAQQSMRKATSPALKVHAERLSLKRALKIKFAQIARILEPTSKPSLAVFEGVQQFLNSSKLPNFHRKAC